ncbi:MAG: hypothetical protein M3O46_19875 [Myxococcota bacterium]|nr:hypothetical protein [Myxococcota bacterium]
MMSPGLPGFAPPPPRPVVVLHLGGAPAVPATPTSPAVPAVAPQTLHVDVATGDTTAHPLGTMPPAGTPVTSVIGSAESFLAGMSSKMKAGLGVGIAAAAFVLFHKSKR